MTSPITVIANGTAVANARPAAGLAMDGQPPLQGPVRLELLVELPIPASWSRRKRATAITGDVLPTSGPGIGNYIKSALDALNPVVVGDDSQIVEVRARKKYSEAPKLVATVYPLDAAASHGAR